MSAEKKTYTISELSELLSAEVFGDRCENICGVNSLSEASPGEISFVSKSKMIEKALESKASALICAKPIDGFKGVQLIVKNVDAALIEVLNLFASEPVAQEGIHSTAIIDQSAHIGDNVSVGPYVIISRGATIGTGSVIGSGCSIGDDVVIGENSKIDANVVIYRRCSIGNNCVIQANATIGAFGFGYSVIDGMPRLVPHNGGVVIEDCVEIGSNSNVDRAKFGNTKIGAGTKIDDMVMIGHNAQIGKCCLIASQSGIAGSVVIGDGVILAGKAGVGDNVTIGDGVIIAARSVALKDHSKPEIISGCPARALNETLRQKAALQRFPQMAKEMKKLVKRVEELEASKND